MVLVLLVVQDQLKGLGHGGNGLASSISGSSVTYAGGGGATGYWYGATGIAGAAALGGGGYGGVYEDALGDGSAGTANTGGGGGGAQFVGSYRPGAGGSGIVIVRYAAMSHFAKLNNNVVTEVIVAEQDFINSGAVGDSFLWVQTSYNGSFRKNYAAVGGHIR